MGCLNADTSACLVGLDGNGMDSVDSGCAMRKTVTHQTSKAGGESSKSDSVIWEIEVPKVTSRWPARVPCPASERVEVTGLAQTSPHHPAQPSRDSVV